jgi:integrase
VEHLRAHGASPSGRGTSVEAWVRLFLDPATNPRAEKLLAEGRQYSPDTLQDYGYKIRRHILTDAKLMALTMEGASEQDLVAYLARLARKLGGPCRTLQSVWSIMRMMWRRYRQLHRDFFDPFENMKKPRVDELKRGALTEAEILTLFTAEGVFKTELERVVLCLAFLSGLRRGEVFGLEPGDLDREAKEIHVVHALKNFGNKDRTVGLPKWGKTRTAPLADITIKAIDELEAKQGRFPRVAVKPDGRTPSEHWWTHHVAICLKRAGIETAGRNIVPHSARHSLASALYARGTQLKTIQEMLGHSDLTTTDLYIHTPADAINEMTAAINQATKKGRAGRVKGKAKKAN